MSNAKRQSHKSSGKNRLQPDRGDLVRSLLDQTR